MDPGHGQHDEKQHHRQRRRQPDLLELEAVWTVWITKVLVPFAPPVMMYGISKTAREPEIARMKVRLMIGRMPGAMM